MPAPIGAADRRALVAKGLIKVLVCVAYADVINTIGLLSVLVAIVGLWSEFAYRRSERIKELLREIDRVVVSLTKDPSGDHVEIRNDSQFCFYSVSLLIASLSGERRSVDIVRLPPNSSNSAPVSVLAVSSPGSFATETTWQLTLTTADGTHVEVFSNRPPQIVG